MSELIRHFASGDYEDRHQRGYESLERNGLVQSTRTDTGHMIHFPGLLTSLRDPHGHWNMHIFHESERKLSKPRTITVNLGGDEDKLGESAMRWLRDTGVMQAMREQMTPGERDDSWPRRFG